MVPLKASAFAAFYVVSYRMIHKDLGASMSGVWALVIAHQISVTNGLPLAHSRAAISIRIPNQCCIRLLFPT